MDIHERSVASPGGRFVCIRTKCDVSGDEQVQTCASKAAKSFYDAICLLIHLRYSVHGHRVRLITVDSDPAFEPVKVMLALLQIELKLMEPGAHEKLLENSVGHEAGRERAVLSSLPWYLPAQYEVYLEKWIKDNSNGMPNSRSSPSTPDILVTGQRRPLHYKYPGATAFGTTAMVIESG
jgi:hypothetical protein